ncbi:GAF domain-containing protein, partial [Patescibacteria group bacterium]|nr:GAF domain-containing protein [Patescibacteria group bacterium]
MRINLILFINLLFICIYLFLGIFVLLRNKRNLNNQSFFALTLFIALWLASNYLVDISSNVELATFFTKLTFFFTAWLFYFLVVFSINFPKRLLSKKVSKIITTIIFLISLAVILLSLSSAFISGTIKESWGYSSIRGSLINLFLVYLFITTGMSVWLIVKKFKNLTGVDKVRVRYLIFGLSLSILIGIIVSIIIPIISGNSQSAKLAPLATIFLIAITSYSIVKHKLFDLRLIILRTITYSLVVLLISAAVVSLTLLLPERLDVSTGVKTTIAIAVSIFIVLILDPLKKGIAKATDNLFFKARVDYRKLLTELSDIINREIDLDVLLYALSRKMETSLKVKNVSIYLAGTMGGAFYKRKGLVTEDGKKKGIGQQQVGDEEEIDLSNRLAHNNPLVKYMLSESQVVVLEALERKIEDTQDEKERQKLETSKKALDALDAAVIAPITVGKNLNAVMVLGPKLSGDPFGSEDLNLLQLIGPQLASALEKSRLYEEAKQFTERLKKEVAMATEGLRSTNLQLQEQNRYLSALQKVTNLITRTLDFRKVTQAITDSIATELGYLGGVLLFLGKNKHRLFPDAVTRSRLTEQVIKLLPKPLSEYYGDFKKDTTRSIKAIKLGKVQIGTDLGEFISPPVPAEVVKQIQKQLNIRTVIAVPIYSEEGIVGVIDFML